MPKFSVNIQEDHKVRSIENEYLQAADYVRDKLKAKPDVLLVLGSGLGALADEMDGAVAVSYREIPHFKTSTAPGHKGRLVAGKLGGKNVIAMQGRIHVYEGYSPLEASLPVQVAHHLGAKNMIVTCACGGVNTDYNVGDICLISDHINLTHPGPMLGMNMSRFKNRFVDMSKVYDGDYIDLAKTVADSTNVKIKEGVYFYMPGPSYETPAEIKAIRTLGGDLVGMSLVHEVSMARLLEMRVLGFGLVTNMAAGILDKPLSEDEVISEGKKATTKFSKLIKGILKKM